MNQRPVRSWSTGSRPYPRIPRFIHGHAGCCFLGSRITGSPDIEPFTRDLCSRLIDEILPTGHADAAENYAQQIPVRVIAQILGVPSELADTFTGWVHDVLEFADDPVRR